jgi:hypothetical protein
MRIRKSVIFSICILLFVLLSVFIPTASADTFKIGNKIQSDIIDTYTSGAYGWAYPQNNLTAILDGNLSTGVAYQFNYTQPWYCEIYFKDQLFVDNITAKPNFGGKASNYDLVMILNFNLKVYRQNYSGERKFYTNVTMIGFQFWIRPYTNYTSYDYYFNDLIINYTPLPSSPNPPINYQQQINEINLELTGIQKDINDIFNAIPAEYNDTILKKELQDQLDIINSELETMKEDITAINTDVPSSYNDTEIKDQIEKIDQELLVIKENIEDIKDTIPLEYNDSVMKKDIINLNSVDIIIKQKIGNLTIELANLTGEIETLSEELRNLESKGTSIGGDSGEKDVDYGLFQNSYIIGLVIIIIFLSLIILKLFMMVYKKQEKELTKPSTENGVYSNVMHEIMFDSKSRSEKDTRDNDKSSEAEFSRALDKKHKDGKVSEGTYRYMKNLMKEPSGSKPKDKS